MSDRLDDDALNVLDEHARSLSWEHKVEVSRETALRDLLDKANRYDRLKSSLRRGSEHVRLAATGNVVLYDGSNLLVLSPRDASALASALSMASHEQEFDDAEVDK